MFIELWSRRSWFELYFLRYLFIPICSLQRKNETALPEMLTNQRQREVKIPNPYLRKIIQVAQQMEIPGEVPHQGASPLGRLCYSRYYMSVHKWCTHLRKRVFGQFNLRERLSSVWHIVICSSPSCHLWKHQREWVMTFPRYPRLTPLRGCNNLSFRYLFYDLHSCP